MLMRAIGGIAGLFAFAMGIGAFEVARLCQVGEFIGETAAAFLYA